jgi:hypothetical protein
MTSIFPYTWPFGVENDFWKGISITGTPRGLSFHLKRVPAAISVDSSTAIENREAALNKFASSKYENCQSQ